jgi:hypothetical protein
MPSVVPVFERDIETLPRHTDGDGANTSPRIQPGMKRSQRRRLRRKLRESKGGGEQATTGVHAIVAMVS